MHLLKLFCFTLLVISFPISAAALAQQDSLEQLVAKTLDSAGDNRSELETALAEIETKYERGMKFLLAHMPPGDAEILTHDFLLEHVRFAYEAWNESVWHEQVSEQMFLNNILPYASVSERREKWRKDFYQRFTTTVADAKTPSEAAVLLNQTIFQELGVKYSTQRKRADQGPYESIENGTASCTGLSILLIDACRSVGVPARFVGTPRWSDNSGNHSWVEIWDQDWKFTGAAEPTGNDLDRAWFTGRASAAKRDKKMYAIYAVSYRRTPLQFPMVWQRGSDPVWSVNVTDRYTEIKSELPEGHVIARIRVSDLESKNRIAAEIAVRNSSGETVASGTTKDERFDSNDHLNLVLPQNTKFEVEIQAAGSSTTVGFETSEQSELYSFEVAPQPSDVLKQLENLLDSSADNGSWEELLSEYPQLAHSPLSKKQAERAVEMFWKHGSDQRNRLRADEIKDKRIQIGDLTMKYDYRVFGKKPSAGYALFISMHGGGGAPARVNEQQWRNQIGLYEPEEGIYLAPRAPTDTWNLWHQAHIDQFFDRIIENFVINGQVDPNRVYLMGYSAGGDGVFQLAPRMADRFAAAAMMAGHPNETRPLGLRNLPFTLHVGGLDSAYNRNKKAEEWKTELGKLHTEDPQGYEHWVEIYPDKGHWMDREDASAIAWMSPKTRNNWPEKIVWHQDDVTHSRLYWLYVNEDHKKARSTVTAVAEHQTIQLNTEGVEQIGLFLSDQLVDLENPITVEMNGEKMEIRPSRTLAAIAKGLESRFDREMAATAFVEIPPTDENKNDKE